MVAALYLHSKVIKMELLNKFISRLDYLIMAIANQPNKLSEFDRGRIIAYSNIIYELENIIKEEKQK